MYEDTPCCRKTAKIPTTAAFDVQLQNPATENQVPLTITARIRKTRSDIWNNYASSIGIYWRTFVSQNECDSLSIIIFLIISNNVITKNIGTTFAVNHTVIIYGSILKTTIKLVAKSINLTFCPRNDIRFSSLYKMPFRSCFVTRS